LHPFCPFITEVLWEQTGERSDFIMQQDWVGLKGAFSDETARNELQWVLKTVSEIRSVRADVNVPAGAKIPTSVVGASEETVRRIQVHHDVICRLARLVSLTVVDAAPNGSVRSVVDEATLALEVAEFLDVDAEIGRLEKATGKLEKEIKSLSGRLSNEAFVAKAPAEVVAEQREKLAELEIKLAKLKKALDQLSSR
ncbi:MAG: class I tRNA ligase family protein, partial [Pseudomonadota bacterium]